MRTVSDAQAPREDRVGTSAGVVPRRPRVLAALVAPWALLFPAWAGRTLAQAGRGSYVAAVAVALVVASATVTQGYYLVETSNLFRYTTFWGQIPGHGFTRYLELIAAITPTVGVTVILVAAGLQLPWIHRTGSLSPSYTRAFRAATPLVGLGTLIATGVLGYRLLEELGVDPPGGSELWDDGLGPLLLAFGPWAGITWFGRLVARLPELPPPELPLRCDECGYDLTPVADDGRCSECGLSAAVSRTGARRPGSAWMRRGGASAFLATTFDLLLRPRAFYGTLRLRTPGATEFGFARWTFAALFVGAYSWGAGVYLLAVRHMARQMGQTWAEAIETDVFFYLVTAAGVFTALCWLGYRAIAAVVFAWAAVREAVPDGRWLGKVIAYEAAFLWAFSAFWGLLLAGAVCLGEGSLILMARRFGVPAGMLIIGTALLGGLGLTGVWLWRYWTAVRLARWSNV